ncbi:NUDIX domain-containing protein [Candidatus Saccharibacteria bacterium]|nr:NUDIX domain-containing protein [Candidatus Saccharibacteria bacterium]
MRRISSRAIVLKDKEILLMKRFKMGLEYYTLPGGSVEPGESLENAAIREVAEETSLVVGSPHLVFVEDAAQPFGQQNIFLCSYISGEPHLPETSEEAFWSTPGKNTYEPTWFPQADLKGIPFVSPLLKEAIIMALKHGFPKKPYHFSVKHSERLS